MTDPLMDAVRAAGPGVFSLAVQAQVDDLLTKSAPPLTVEQRKRLIKAVDRTLRVRREVLRLAGFAVGHRPRRPGGSSCAKCWKGWPCPDVLDAARSALDAFADCDWTQDRASYASVTETATSAHSDQHGESS